MIYLFIFLSLVNIANSENKYSASANGFYPDSKGPIKSYAGVASPFRMQKVNLLWEKARTKLTENKLELLYSQLKVQDKDELTLKKLRGEGADKDGSKEAEVRKKFNSIMLSFGLGGTPEKADTVQASPKALFKDKKLQRLWEKAEQAGLSSEELVALQDEFKHHQGKIDEYNALLELAGDRDSKRFNEIRRELNEEEFDIRDTNEITRKAKEMKQNYDRLHRLATNVGEEQQFGEPKVAGLWKLALTANFDPVELESLREELGHYEKRLEKMHFIQAELQLVEERHGGKYGLDDDDKLEGRRIMDKKLQKHTEAVAKLHESLESKIMARHNEL